MHGELSSTSPFFTRLDKSKYESDPCVRPVVTYVLEETEGLHLVSLWVGLELEVLRFFHLSRPSFDG